jgi:hypothetical protein
MPSGEILSVEDHGTVWQLVYQIEGNVIDSIYFDHRPFSHFYEGATGRSFFHDYNFGVGREYVSNQLKGRRICVEGEFPEQTVSLDD